MLTHSLTQSGAGGRVEWSGLAGSLFTFPIFSVRLSGSSPFSDRWPYEKMQIVLIVTYLLPSPSLFLKYPIYSWMWHEHGLTANAYDQRRKSIMICWKNCSFYIQQNIVDLKIIWYKVFTFDFAFKISGDLTKPGVFFLDSLIYVCKCSLKLWNAIDLLQSMNPNRWRRMW